MSKKCLIVLKWDRILSINVNKFDILYISRLTFFVHVEYRYNIGINKGLYKFAVLNVSL